MIPFISNPSRRPPARRKLDRRGMAAVEFALVASITLSFLVTIMDVGRYLGDQHALDYAVATAARYAAVNSTTASTSTITSKFDTAASGLLGSCGSCNVKISYSPSYKVGGTVTVSVTYPWSSVSALTFLGIKTLSSATTLTVVN
jgi:Flp pilus assembly protein TadG